MYLSGGFSVLVGFKLPKIFRVFFWVTTVHCITHCYQPFRGSSCQSPACWLH